MVERALKKQRSETGEPFAAFMGFSQGAKVGAALAMKLQSLRQRRDGGFTSYYPKFSIFLMGVCPLMDGFERLRLPTIHVVGKHDFFRQESWGLWADCCDEDSTTLIELPIGHHLPTLEEHTRMIAAEVLKMYNQLRVT